MFSSIALFNPSHHNTPTNASSKLLEMSKMEALAAKHAAAVLSNDANIEASLLPLLSNQPLNHV